MLIPLDINSTTEGPIIKNWMKLMQCDINAVLNFLKNDIGYVPSFQYNGQDYTHHKRLILFDLNNRNFHQNLIRALIHTNQQDIAENLTISKVHSDENQSDNENPEPTNNNSPKKIEIKVKHSTSFHLPSKKVYSTKSKNRCHVLLINNIDFGNSETHPYRNGADLDETNLLELFNQIGGCSVENHRNKTGQEMKEICENFAKAEHRKLADIYFIIIMSHGNELFSDTIFYGIDDVPVRASWIQEQFNNKNVPLFFNKPKIFIYQACRESSKQKKEKITEHDGEYDTSYVRPHDNMLIAHSTCLGEDAKRHPENGSWYIQCICKIFMDHCHALPVTELMEMVDQAMMNYGPQTPQFVMIGFKKCYLHPGIYEEGNKVHTFHKN